MLMLPPVPHLENKLLFDCHIIKADMDFVKCFITSEIRKKNFNSPKKRKSRYFWQKIENVPN